VRRIQLQFFGGVSEIEKESDTPGREFVLAFVGPLLSLVLAAVFFGGMQLVEDGTVPGVLLAGLMVSNSSWPSSTSCRAAAGRRPDAAGGGLEAQRPADGRYGRRRLGRQGAWRWPY